MKFSTLLAGAFASIALAAPSRRAQNGTSVDAAALNGLVFAQLDLNYLLGVNTLDLTLFQQLALTNNLDILAFQDAFNSDTFDVASLLRFQQLSTLLAIAGTGALTSFDLTGLPLGDINLQLIAGIASVDLTQFVEVALVPQITVISQQGTHRHVYFGFVG